MGDKLISLGDDVVILDDLRDSFVEKVNKQVPLYKER